jgi:hypothetical protein
MMLSRSVDGALLDESLRRMGANATAVIGDGYWFFDDVLTIAWADKAETLEDEDPPTSAVIVTLAGEKLRQPNVLVYGPMGERGK